MARWDGIDEFIEVVETGSFTAAADKLGVSKSYISKQMTALEERFGARLLQRTTRQMTLTDVGEVFYQQCRKMAAQFDRTEGLISQLQNAPVGTLRIALNGTFGVRYMAGAVAAFSRQYPQLAVEVTSTYQDVDMSSDNFDLTIRYGDIEDSSNIVARRLGSHTLCLSATPEYFSRKGMPKKPADLKDHNCLVGPQRIWYFTQNGSTLKQRVEGNWISEDGATLLAAACHGIGLAQLPDFYVQSRVESGQLVRIDEEWAQYTRVAKAVFPKSRHLSTKVRLFIDFLLAWVREEFEDDYPLFLNK